MNKSDALDVIFGLSLPEEIKVLSQITEDVLLRTEEMTDQLRNAKAKIKAARKLNKNEAVENILGD